ncbi:MAG: DMT family transporter [Alphaproteobacteria bacterium]|nr:DMT family transporter [Alphaproteobacteria bacterium]
MSDAPALAAPRAGGVGATLGLVLLVLIWGSYFPVVEVLLADWDPLLMSASRTALAAVTLLGFLVAFEGRASLTRPTPWGKVYLLGFVGIFFNVICFAFAIDWSGAVTTSLISGGCPVIAALMGHRFFGERLTRWGWLAVAVTVGGATLIVFGAGLDDLSFRGGEVLVVLGYIAWYWYAAMSQRWLAGSSQLRSSTLTMGVGTLMIAVVSLLLFGTGVLEPRWSLAPASLSLIAFSGAISVGLGLLLWNIGVSRVGIAVASFYTNLAPIVAVGLGVWLGGVLTWVQALGGSLVIAAVVCVQRWGVRRRMV